MPVSVASTGQVGDAMDVKSKTENKTELRETCDTCGLPKSRVGGNSLTAWIFGKSGCACSTAGGASSSIAGTSSTEAEAGGELVNIDDKFETISELGSGGMGTVYKVRDKSTNQIFALKVLRPELASDREAVQRFKQEVTAAQTLAHPNLVSVYDFGVNMQGSPYFVMDFVEGESLSSRIAKEKTIGLHNCLDIMMQVCEALKHAHDNNIIHRDLKPSNILITKTENDTDIVKVVDFGIAKILPPPGKDTVSLTRTAEIFGSPAYMSPEQCKGERVDKRSDIYSLGCVMYEALIGQPPFLRDNPVKTILAHIYDQPPSVRSKLLGLPSPDAVASVINACLAKDPAERYPTIDKLADDLRSLQDDKPATWANAQVSKRKRRRELKFMGFKYFPQVLSILTIVMLVVAVQDLPWLLALADLKKAHSLSDREQFSRRVVANADQYNKPFALLMTAEAAREAGQDIQSRDDAMEALKLFKARNDYSGMMPSYCVAIGQELRLGNLEAARQLAVDSTKMRNDAIANPPRKGMKLLGWFYLPPFTRDASNFNKMYRNILMTFYSYDDKEGAGQFIDAMLKATEEQLQKVGDQSVGRTTTIRANLEWNALKTIQYFKIGENWKAYSLADETVDRYKKLDGQTDDVALYDISMWCFQTGDEKRAVEVMSTLKHDFRHPYLERNTALAVFNWCKDPKDKATREKLYCEALKTMSIYTSYTSSPVAISSARGFLNVGKTDAVTAMYEDLIAACDKLLPEMKSDFLDPNNDYKSRIRNRLPEIKVHLLTEYATLLTLMGETARSNIIRSKAEQAFLKLEEPTDRSLLLPLARGYMWNGDLNDAERIYRALLAEDVKKTGYDLANDQLDSACLQRKRGNLNAACDQLNQVIIGSHSSASQKSIAETALGNISFEQGDYQRAAEHFEKADPYRDDLTFSYAFTLYNAMRHARALDHLGQHQKALEALRPSLYAGFSFSEQQAQAFRLYAELLRKIGKDKEAAAFDRRADTMVTTLGQGDRLKTMFDDLDRKIQCGQIEQGY